VPLETPTKRQGRDLRKVVSTRGGSAAAAVITALLAGAVLLVFLSQYKDSVKDDNDLTTALVAQRLIEKGSSGDVIATQGLYQTTRIKKGDLKDGAISDPANLRGKAAAKDILPGEQLTANDFTAAGDSLASRLAGDQRAIALPLDGAHGLIGQVRTGDRVDVIGGFNWDRGGSGASIPVARVLAQNVLVLKAPAKAKSSAVGGSEGNNLVLQVPVDTATELAFASDNGKLWVVERPKAGSKNASERIVRLETLLVDSRPIPTDRIGRGGR
jgi:Flp pilus assembly protein CpaB